LVKGAKYDNALMGYMRIFENITHTSLIDCFEDQKGVLNFFVDQNNIGKAIGKKAVNIRLLENKFNKKIKVSAYNSDLKSFLNNLLFPIVVESIDYDPKTNIIQIQDPDFSKKSMIIGRNASNLRNYEYIVRRFFPDLKEIKVK
jgi:NusA-like KH domain protein